MADGRKPYKTVYSTVLYLVLYDSILITEDNNNYPVEVKGGHEISVQVKLAYRYNMSMRYETV